ncbi:MAG TPA: helix-turn-helix domain-containing protein [Solirubrobacteraceae bacterium]|nr:helix-turn-helix domain-containing protein [Solirubrobacteraceae bacterium]
MSRAHPTRSRSQPERSARAEPERSARTQPERSAATQAALISAARRLWGARGYAEVGTPEIAEAAGVTRGAMYHQYADKAALFRAVIEAVETEAMERLSAAVLAAEPGSPAAALRIAADAWLAIATEPEIRRLVLLDAPAVLGWAAWRELGQRYGLGMTEQLLASAIEAGELRAQPVRPLATVLLGAIDEAALVIADAADPAAAQADVRAVVHDLLDGLLQAGSAL